MLEFGSANYSSTISENDPNDISYSRHNSYHYSNAEKEPNEMNESQYSEYLMNKNNFEIATIDNNTNDQNSNNMVEYEEETYNSFNFESRVADYGKKSNLIYKSDEFGSQISNSTERGGYVPPNKISGYIPPKKKVTAEYTKDDFPSNNTDDEDQYQFKNKNKEFVSNSSFSDYEGMSQVGEIQNSNMKNKVNVNKQETIDYNSGYDDGHPYYFMTGIDPK